MKIRRKHCVAGGRRTQYFTLTELVKDILAHPFTEVWQELALQCF